LSKVFLELGHDIRDVLRIKDLKVTRARAHSRVRRFERQHSYQTRSTGAFFWHKDSAVGDTGLDGGQVIFNIACLAPLATYLQLSITAAEKGKTTVCVVSHKVTGTIYTVTRCHTPGRGDFI
jgi:hypothetical protein